MQTIKHLTKAALGLVFALTLTSTVFAETNNGGGESSDTHANACTQQQIEGGYEENVWGECVLRSC